MNQFELFLMSKYLLINIFILMTDSDDSEDEGGMGNLNRLIIRPPGHSGKAKKGHLCFDASFETGKNSREK